MSVCGAATYKRIKSLISPSKPTEKSFDEIVQLMSDHYNPKPTATVQRCLFNARSRKPGESVAKFVAELKELAEYCDFGAKLDEMIRDRLVCGISDERWQKRLLSEAGLTYIYKRAFELAQGMEAAERNAQQIKQPGAPGGGSVNFAGRKTSDKKETPTNLFKRYVCYRCNGNHKAPDCRYKNVTCRACGRIGHVDRACRSMPQKNAERSPYKPTTNQYYRGPPKQAHHVDAVDSAEQTDDEYASMYNVTSAKVNPILVTVKLNGVATEMEVDTGGGGGGGINVDYQHDHVRATMAQSTGSNT